MKASNKDIRRTIFRNKKRFCSILIITALGVMMLSGLKAACDDLRYSADQFYDEQQVFDIQIVSTMGLNEDDLAALRKANGIERAEGVYRETVYTSVNGSSQNADVQTLGGQLNTPYLLKGRLPENEKEIAVSKPMQMTAEKQSVIRFGFMNHRRLEVLTPYRPSCRILRI